MDILPVISKYGFRKENKTIINKNWMWKFIKDNMLN